MPTITLQQTTNLADMKDTFKDTKDAKLLRINENETSLHTKSSKLRGFGNDATTRREAKYQRAVDQVKSQLDAQFGKGVGTKILSDMNITNRISVGQLKAITSNLANDAKDAIKEQLASEMSNHIAPLQSKVLALYQEMHDVPSSKPARESSDPIRTNLTKKESIVAMQKVHDDIDAIDELNIDECACCVMNGMSKNQIVSTTKIDTLMQLDCVEQAVGDMTSANTMGKTVVSFDPTEQQIETLGEDEAWQAANAERELSMHQGALELKEYLTEMLTTDELAFFKAQAKFVKDLSELQVQKVGYCGNETDTNTIKAQLWAKTNTVNSATLLGFEITELAQESDLSMKECMFSARNLMTAMAIHYDTIFD